MDGLLNKVSLPGAPSTLHPFVDLMTGVGTNTFIAHSDTLQYISPLSLALLISPSPHLFISSSSLVPTMGMYFDGIMIHWPNGLFHMKTSMVRVHSSRMMKHIAWAFKASPAEMFGIPPVAIHICTVLYHNQTLHVDDRVATMRCCSMWSFWGSGESFSFLLQSLCVSMIG